MRSSFFIVCFFISVVSTAQESANKVISLLKAKESIPFNEYVEETERTSDENKLKVDVLTSREIIPGFSEGVIHINEENSGQNNEPGSANAYTIKFLATTSRIFYYELKKGTASLKFSMAADVKGPGDDKTIDRFRDDDIYNRFTATFKEIYDVPIKDDDLFLTNVIYGDHCGISGTAPDYLLLLQNFIENKNIDSINQWLRSANTEKQVYAIRGFRLLEEGGYQLTDQENKIISLVKKKEGSMRTCWESLLNRDQIELITHLIATTPVKYLRIESNVAKTKSNSGFSIEKNITTIIIGASLLSALCYLLIVRIKTNRARERMKS